MQAGDPLAALARQLGLVRLDRAVVTAAETRRKIRRGELRWVRRGVYCANPSQQHSFAEAVVAALMVLPTGSIACGLTAARLWRIGALPRPTPDEPIHLLLPRRVDQLAGCRLHFRSPMPPVDHPGGIPATSIAASVLWLAAESPFPEALAIAEATLFADPRLSAELRAELSLRPPRRGASAARRVVDVAREFSESPLESRARALWIERQLPEPIQQAEVREAGRFIARVDFLWPDAMLVVEVDGFAKYEHAGELRRDRARHNRLDALGYTVRRFTWADIVHDGELVAAQIRTVLCLD